MSGPETLAEKPVPEDIGQANERAIRQKRREAMSKIEKQYTNLSGSMESKLRDLNLSPNAVKEKFGKLVTQQEKMNEFFLISNFF